MATFLGAFPHLVCQHHIPAYGDNMNISPASSK